MKSNTNKIAAEAAEQQVAALEERGYLDFDGGEQEDRQSVVNQLATIIQSAIEKAVSPYRDAIEELVDWQNGPPLLSPKWLDGWNGTMEKACALIGRKHERQNN